MTTHVTDFYNGKSIFITGGTGFVGICLVEKLLRCCPDIKNIYLLMRPKKGKQIAERLEELTKNSVSSTSKCIANVLSYIPRSLTFSAKSIENRFCKMFVANIFLCQQKDKFDTNQTHVQVKFKICLMNVKN